MTNVGPTPIRATDAQNALINTDVSGSSVDMAGDLAAEASQPIGDHSGSEEYKRGVVNTLTDQCNNEKQKIEPWEVTKMAKKINNNSINGTPQTGEVEDRLLLVHFIRDDCSLTGTHIGCDSTHCGAVLYFSMELQ